MSAVTVTVRVGLLIYYIQAENVRDSFIKAIRSVAKSF